VDVGRADVVVIGVDTGGTFTDVFASNGVVLKVPSTPSDPSVAILHGLHMAGVTARDAVGHGTTVATNAVLERKGARTVLLTTEGFEDVLEIRRQNRPSLYDLRARWPDPLVGRDDRLGVRERLDYRGDTLTPLDLDGVSRLVTRIAGGGVESVAICFLFSYANPGHERAVAQALREALGSQFPISLSHEIAPHYGEFERTSTTVVNAYVMPIMRRYLDALEGKLTAHGIRQLHVMHSNGGLVGARAAADRPVQTVLSGPAAGVVGAHALATAAGHDRIITFDMGGTSTDVAVVPGEVLESGEGEISSFPLLVPMLQMETVGAGGGSIARVDSGGGLHVGPESAGADPGPAAYGRGVRPTVTDANLVLGRLSTHGLLGGAMPLDVGRARDSLRTIAGPLGLTVEQAAWAIVRLANSNMERAVRTVTLQRGHDPRRFTLFPFGGAGPLHAVELAAGLGIETLLVPPHPGVMAALGLTIPDLQRDFQRTVLLPLRDGVEAELEKAFDALEVRAEGELEREELFGEPVLRRWVDARYSGQSFQLRIPFSGDASTLVREYTRAYEERYGHATPERQVDVVNVRLRAVLPRLQKPRLIPQWPEPARPEEERQVWFGSSLGVQDVRSVSARVLWRPGLKSEAVVEGPAVVEQYDSATVLPPGWQATVDDSFNLLVTFV
jgi:N-methylhydantoinase A